MLIIRKRPTSEPEQKGPFREFIRRRSEGEIFVPPTMLSSEDRRLHVRQTLREDNEFRIKNRPEGAQSKFDKLASSPFTFFRGTALLFYRDYAGTDMDMPFVFTVGDIHPANFGVMPNEDGAPFFGVNDYDEACLAPFTYDIKRGAVGFYIVARENGLKKKRRTKVVRAWVTGYLEGLRSFAEDDRERWFQFRIDNSPTMIRKLLESAQKERKTFLEDMVDLEKELFRATEEIVPHSKHIEEFQKAINAYKGSIDVNMGNNPKRFFQVKDVAIKKDSGTASLGLDRYFVLIEGSSEDPSDDRILELKQTRKSALGELLQRGNEPDSKDGRNQADNIVRAHEVHVVGGDPLYGITNLRDRSFVVREKSPYKDEIDIEDLNAKGLEEYARICGQVLAQTHARSDVDTGVTEGQVETQILGAIDPELFVDDMERFAKEASKRVFRDFKAFKADHALGAFQFFNTESDVKGKSV